MEHYEEVISMFFLIFIFSTLTLINVKGDIY